MARRSLHAPLALLLLALHAPLASAAEPASSAPSASSLETARALFNEGKELRDRGDLAGALSKFKAAHELGRTPITGLELARTHQAQGQWLEAREVCLGIARLPVTSAETERSTAAREDAARLAEELRPQIPSVVVRVQNVPEGATPVVTLDRAPLPASALALPVKVNPGRHEVSAKLPRGPESFVMFEVEAGQTREVQLAVAPAPPLAPGVAEEPAEAGPTPPIVYRTPSGTRARSPELAAVGFVALGIGAVVGTVTGLISISKADYVRERCEGHRCPPFAHDALDQAKTFGVASTVSFVVAGAGLVLGIYGASRVTRDAPASASPAKPPKPTFLASPMGIHGTF